MRLPEEMILLLHLPLGFHIPGIYDKVLDINECLLLPEPSNAIRNEVRRYALAKVCLFMIFVIIKA